MTSAVWRLVGYSWFEAAMMWHGAGHGNVNSQQPCRQAPPHSMRAPSPMHVPCCAVCPPVARRALQAGTSPDGRCFHSVRNSFNISGTGLGMPLGRSPSGGSPVHSFHTEHQPGLHKRSHRNSQEGLCVDEEVSAAAKERRFGQPMWLHVPSQTPNRACWEASSSSGCHAT